MALNNSGTTAIIHVGRDMRLFGKIFFLLFGIGIIPLSLLGWFSFTHIEAAMVKTTNKALLVSADVIGSQLKRAITDSYSAVKRLAASKDILSTTWQDELSIDMVGIKRFYPIIKDISLLDHKGNVLSSVEYSFRGNWATTKWFANASIGQHVLSDVHTTASEDLVMTVAVPVMDKVGRVRYVIICDLSVDYLIGIVSDIVVGKSGRVKIINRNGVYVVANDKRKILAEETSTEIKEAIYKKTSQIVHVKHDIAAIAPIARSNIFPLTWYVLIQQPTGDVYQGIARVRVLLTLSIILLLVLVSLVSILLSRSISVRFNRLLVAIKHLPKADFSIPIEDPVKDELGELAIAFNHVRLKLDKSRQDSALYSNNLEALVKKRTDKLRQTQSRLIESAHNAGMAEVATGILHNIGNINTTINATTERLVLGIKMITPKPLWQMLNLLEEQDGNLGSFLIDDPRGQKILPYIRLYLEKQKKQIEKLLTDANILTYNLIHINEIIRLQQDYASGDKLAWEECKIEDLTMEALHLLYSYLENRKIKVTREFLYGESVPVSRSQLIQIIVNLLKNALESFAGLEQDEKEIVIIEKLVEADEAGPKRVELSISDNGIGFDASIATNIFNYGFSTKNKHSGHGYGLHFCVNYLQSIGGNLTAKSDGLHRGATFTVLYPLKPTKSDLLAAEQQQSYAKEKE